MTNTFSIAIDGPCGAGKSTIAKAVARALNAIYLDTGAMYRTVGLYMLRNGVSLTDQTEIARRTSDVRIAVTYHNGVQHIYLDKEDVSEAIRAPEISLAASAVSVVGEVREHLVRMQQEIARGQNVVMDGRDIGTHVLPNATLKIYLTASAEVRARRRYDELRARGLTDSYAKVLEELNRRDLSDMTRRHSPLTRAADAVEVDSSHLSLEETIQQITDMCQNKVEGADVK